MSSTKFMKIGCNFAKNETLEKLMMVAKMVDMV